MKLKKEYAILGVLILALGLYLYFDRQDQIHYALPATPALEADAITRLEIARADGTLTLTRQEDQWRVAPGDYPADPAQVKRMLDAVAGLRITALVSESQSYARYELDDEHRIAVRAYQGDETVRRFAVGKAAETFRHTHVRLGDDPNVYHAAGSFRWEFDKPVDELRDKTVLAVDRAAVTAITLTAGDETLVVRKQTAAPEAEGKAADPSGETSPAGDQASPPPEVKWETADGTAVATDAVDQLLSALSPLKCSAFLDSADKSTLTDPKYRVRLEGRATQTLEIYSPAADAADFPGTSSDSPYPFKLSEFEVSKIEDFHKAVAGTGDEDENADAPASDP